jgi:hypothetical protein
MIRELLVVMLGCSVGVSGCAENSRPVTAVEYRPRLRISEVKAPRSQVFVLWRWQPIAPLVAAGQAHAVGAATRPAVVLKDAGRGRAGLCSTGCDDRI